MWPLHHKTKERQTMNSSRKTTTNWLSAIGYRLTLGVLVSVFAVTAFAADCKVNDSDISNEYFGNCVNGLAQGKGKAKGKDTYEGDFKQGNKSGRGVYIWSNGDRYEGGFLDDRMNGMGVYNFVDGSTYVGEYKSDKKNGYGVLKAFKNDAKGHGLEGQLVGDFYVRQGLFVNGNFILACTSSQNCKQEQTNREAQERRDRAARDEEYRRDAPARQARQMCEAQKQSCLASCPAWRSGINNDTHFSCNSRCNGISCY
jgi:hypothetical protein